MIDQGRPEAPASPGRWRRVPVNVTMPPQYVERLRHESAVRGLSISDLVRRALDLLLGTGQAPRLPAEHPTEGADHASATR